MADFFVQRGTAIIATGETTEVITAGVDYTAPAAASKAFIRIVGTHLTGAAERNATYGADTWGVSIQNASNLTTSVTFERYDADVTDTAQVDWEIIEYVGSAGGANEFIVREQTEIARLSSSDTITTGAVSGIVTDADVVVFITGQRSDITTSSSSQTQHISAWNAGADTATLSCFRNEAFAASISYAVVEFTGSNWIVQRHLHTYSSAGATETETLSPTLGDVAKAFVHAQYRQGQLNCDDHGHQVWISATAAVSFFVDSGASLVDLESVAWIIENTQSDGTEMNVLRYSGTSTALGNFTETVTAVTMVESSLMGECATLNQPTSSPPRQYTRLRLTGVDTVTLNRESSTATLSYRFEVVEWPTVVALRIVRRRSRAVNLVKPLRWNFEPVLVAPEWGWFWNSHIVGWPFWEGGGDIRSVARPGINGVLTNGANWVTDRDGAAIDFDGLNDLIELSTIPVGHPLQLDGIKWTVFARMFVDSTAIDPFMRLIDKSSGGDAADGWSCILNTSSGDRRLAIACDNDGANPTVNYKTDAASYVEDTWIDVVFQFGGDVAGDYHLWVDGDEKASAFVQGGANGFAPSVETNCRIGTWNHTSGREFKGRLSLLSFHRGISNPAQIRQVYNDPYGPFRMAQQRISKLISIPVTPKIVTRKPNRARPSKLKPAPW